MLRRAGDWWNDGTPSRDNVSNRLARLPRSAWATFGEVMGRLTGTKHLNPRASPAEVLQRVSKRGRPENVAEETTRALEDGLREGSEDSEPDVHDDDKEGMEKRVKAKRTKKRHAKKGRSSAKRRVPKWVYECAVAALLLMAFGLGVMGIQKSGEVKGYVVLKITPAKVKQIENNVKFPLTKEYPDLLKWHSWSPHITLVKITGSCLTQVKTLTQKVYSELNKGLGGLGDLRNNEQLYDLERITKFGMNFVGLELCSAEHRTYGHPGIVYKALKTCAHGVNKPHGIKIQYHWNHPHITILNEDWAAIATDRNKFYTTVKTKLESCHGLFPLLGKDVVLSSS